MHAKWARREPTAAAPLAGEEKVEVAFAFSSFSRPGLEEAFTGLHFALPARSRRCRAQSVGFFSPALLWWFLARVHAAWGRGGGRAWPGLARGRGGGVVAMSGQVPRLEPGYRCERRGVGEKLGGMVSPALFPCGRTGSAREDLRTRTMSSPLIPTFSSRYR